MKKTTILPLLAAVMIATGCAATASIPDRLDRFVEKTDTAKLRKSIEGVLSSIDTATLYRRIEEFAKVFGGEQH